MAALLDHLNLYIHIMPMFNSPVILDLVHLYVSLSVLLVVHNNTLN